MQLLKPKKSRRKPAKEINCEGCGRPTWVRPYAFKFKNHFCSRECRIDHQKKNAFHLFCIICGDKFFCQPCQVGLRNRKTCSRQCRGKLKSLVAQKKRDSGILTKHQIDRGLRYSKKADDWRKAVFDRDNYTCQGCGVRGCRLEAHHKKPFAYFPALRFEVSNGETLCCPCHNKTKINFKKLRKKWSIKDVSEKAKKATVTEGSGC